ncbi:DUF1963 domain-containing protein [Butyrivibrio sp. XPD2002]|uniref:DUF1963 domain-containing protein n=1 Tax=Butyrivibrio sp. XPD2002 TaxID=1280665 RepID=UPI0003FBCE36|nr:DUF1963 domain-containing protein [Butyrivibrio sp. XPD2002]
MEKEEVRKIIQDNIRNQIELDIKENNDGVAVDGTIHFYIKREDLQALNFDNIEYILDCS